MRKSKTHLQKKHAINVLCGVREANKNNANLPHKDLKQTKGVSKEYCQQIYDEIYFEILGFEQSSTIQIVSNYAKECNVELRLDNSTLSHANFMQQDDNKTSTLSQEYGIIASGLIQNLETFFNILESLFAEKMIKGNIAEFVIQKLQQNKQNICIAESCTGGVLSSMITAVNGASSVFKGGITTYSIQSKQQILGVKDSIIKEHGVYSEACVRAMARGVLDLFQADIAIATSGLATKDTSANNFLNLPAGMVFTCVLIRDRLPISISHNYLSHSHNIAPKDSRIFVQKEASLNSLRLLLNVLAY